MSEHFSLCFGLPEGLLLDQLFYFLLPPEPRPNEFMQNWKGQSSLAVSEAQESMLDVTAFTWIHGSLG